MTQEDEIAKLQLELQLDPKSPEFTRLADVYLSREMFDEAETLLTRSLKFHPKSASGLVLMGRVLKHRKKFPEAAQILSDATFIATENWRAWLELAETYLEMKMGKKALHAFKKVLFFNPTHPLARRVVAKLELLTADEYEDDIFQMQKLPEAANTTGITEQSPPTKSWSAPTESLVRALSYIDALILRQNTERALSLLNEYSIQFGEHPEIESRKLKLSVFENPTFIAPKSAAESSLAKQKIVREKKIEVLELLLRRIEENKSDLLST